MPDDDFYTPTDIDALRMENELLSLEIRFLKARFADIRRAIEEETAQYREQMQRARRISPQRRAELETAEKDLISLLRKLLGGPLGPLLRRRKSFRDLEQRYLR